MISAFLLFVWLVAAVCVLGMVALLLMDRRKQDARRDAVQEDIRHLLARRVEQEAERCSVCASPGRRWMDQIREQGKKDDGKR